MQRTPVFASVRSSRRLAAGTVTITLLTAGLSALSITAPNASATIPAVTKPVPRQTPHAAPLPADETAAASHWALPTITFPAPGASTVAVSSSSLSAAGVVRVAPPAALGTLGLPLLPKANAAQPDHMKAPAGVPVWAPSTTAAPSAVTIETLGSAARQAMHDAPLVLQVTRADGGASAGPVALSIDYSGFRDAYGGSYADRLELVRYPACVLVVPDDPSCSTGTPVAGQVNNPYTTTMTAVVDADADTSTAALPGATSPSAAAGDTPSAVAQPAAAPRAAVPLPSATTSAAPTDSAPASLSASASPSPTDTTSATPGSVNTGSVFVVQAAGAGPSGSFIASPLSPSASWSVGLQSGTFNYSYPISVPAPMGGAAPRVALDYDSGSIDGRTSSSNPQASTFGMGWDYEPGFIEREYDSCDRNGGSYPDECYVSSHQNVTLSLNGQSMHLIVDGSTGSWRMQDDPGWLVVHGTGASNGDKTGEYWKLQSPDGTTYYFGRGFGRKPLNSSPPPTNSTWTEPVWNWDSSCTATLPTPCTKAWRWNLDYVVDRNNNATAYYYGSETNAYKAHNGATATQYVRGGHIVSITYGYRDPDALTVNPADEVLFTTVGRCVQNANGGTNTCPAMNTTNATSFPDVPVDQVCAAGSTTCTNTSPTFFDDSMVSSITTKVLSSGSTYVALDSYALQLNFPDPDGTGPESPTLWPAQVTHTGLVGGSVALPPMILFGTVLPNRADVTTGVSPVDQYRVSQIFNETGGELAINYDTPDLCNVNLSDHSQNTNDCFPVHWVPEGSTNWVAGWFYKYLVTRVGRYVNYAGETPGTSSPQLTAEPIVTDYTYGGGAAWHKNEFQLNATDTDTWNEYRGYKTVTVTEDEVTDGVISTTASRSVTVHTFYRGMYGDPYLSGDQPATNTDTVTTADFGSTPDSAWLAGREAETVVQTRAGTLQQRTDVSYWTSQTASMASVGGDPAEVAVEVQPYTTYVDMPKANGQIRQHEVVDVHYNAGTSTDIANGAIVTHVDAGDAGISDPEANCTTINYTSNTSVYIIEPQLKETFSGRAGASGCPGTGMLSESRYYYDGAHGLNNGPPSPPNVPTNGNLTCTRVYLTAAATGDCPATQVPSAIVADTYVVYDIYGRVTSSTDGDGHTTQTQYTPTSGRPTSILTTSPSVSLPSPHSLTSTSALDYRGMPTSTSDNNSPANVTKMVYDPLGRLIKAYAPTESALATDTPTFIANYNPQRTTWSTIETQNLIDIDSGGVAHYRDTWTYLDGWQRTREVHTVPYGGAGHLTVETRYDDIGEVSANTSPYWGNTGVSYGMDYTAAKDVPLETRYSYDPLHRQTIAARTVYGAQNWGNTTTSYAADQTVTTPPAPAPATTSTIDVWGRPLTSTENGQTDATTSTISYVYDSLGRMTSVTDDAGKTDSYFYDLGGRRTSSTDADAGTSTVGYDAVGNVTSTIDALGVTVNTTYDELNRPTLVSTTGRATAPTFPSGTLAAYTYDSTAAHGLGQLASTTVYDLGNAPTGQAGNAWTTTINNYDADGRPLSQTSAIPAVSGLAGTTNYTISTSYLANGSPSSVSYPAIGGLPSETQTQLYEDSGGSTGLPVSTYVQGELVLNDYNSLDQLSTRRYDTTNSDLGATVRSYSYGDPLQRLSNIQTSVTQQASQPLAVVQNDSYSYDNANNPTDIIDGTSVNQQTCFNYDGLDRLVKAWTQTTGSDHCATYPGATVAVGPAGFNQQYAYAGNGVPTKLWNGSAETDYTMDPTHPHAIATAVTGTATNSYGYDTDGRQSTRTVSGTTTTLSWDPLNHLYQSTSAAATTTYVNNVDGSRIARQDPDGSTTLWVGPDELHVVNGAITGTRYYNLGGTTIATRTASGISWLTNDTQDSRQVAVNATNGVVTRAYYTPYGAPRSGGGVLPTDEGFLGHVTDSTSGLVQDGARYYDPTLSQFLSPDPLSDLADSILLDPYGYAADNPAGVTDPSGLASFPIGAIQDAVNAINAMEEQSNLAVAVYENRNQAASAAMFGFMDLASLDAGLPVTGPGLMQATDQQEEESFFYDQFARKGWGEELAPLLGHALGWSLVALGLVDGVTETVGLVRGAIAVVRGIRALRAGVSLTRAGADLAEAGGGDAASGAGVADGTGAGATTPVAAFQMWSVDSLSASGSRLVGKDLTRAGQELAKHAGQGAFPKAVGSPGTISRLGQEQLDDILTAPGTRVEAITKGNFAGGRYYIASDGRGAAFDADGMFEYFGIFR